MRLDIRSLNRLGITQEALAVFAEYGVDVRAIDMITHHTYVDVPTITRPLLEQITSRLLNIPGINDVVPTDRLPSEVQRAQLNALISAVSDPILTVSGNGEIQFANRGAATAFGIDAETLPIPLRRLLEAGLADQVLNDGFSAPDRELEVRGEGYILHCTPLIYDDDDVKTPESGVLIFQSRARIGGIVTALQSPGAEGFEAILGSSAVMTQTRERALRLAVIEAPLLIEGETGTGKEMFARACHRASGRKAQPFLALNCAALPETLAESELFGYESGAFTNASRGGKPGLFELGDGGTVFLDEIGELSLYLQAKLLRFMQDGSFRRIGGHGEKRVNVRIIAATNRNLAKMAESGTFRADLLFRLNVLNVYTPPLRERREDIPELASTFAARSAVRIGRSRLSLSKCAMQRLQNAQWPGNVRELENVIFRSASLTDASVLTADHLMFNDEDRAATISTSMLPYTNYKTAFDAFERRYFSNIAQTAHTARSVAALTGLSTATAARKLRKHRQT